MNKKTLVAGCVVLLIILFVYGKHQKTKAINGIPGTWMSMSQHFVITKAPHNADSFMVHMNGGHYSELDVGYFGRVSWGNMKGKWENGMIKWDGQEHDQWRKMMHNGHKAQRMPMSNGGKPVPNLVYNNGLRSTLLKPDDKPEFKIPVPWTM